MDERTNFLRGFSSYHPEYDDKVTKYGLVLYFEFGFCAVCNKKTYYVYNHSKTNYDLSDAMMYATSTIPDYSNFFNSYYYCCSYACLTYLITSSMRLNLFGEVNV
jgi:hypothetical protein